MKCRAVGALLFGFALLVGCGPTLQVKTGFDHAASFLPNADQTAAEKEDLLWPKS